MLSLLFRNAREIISLTFGKFMVDILTYVLIRARKTREIEREIEERRIKEIQTF
jgi:hypothetical protein